MVLQGFLSLDWGIRMTLMATALTATALTATPLGLVMIPGWTTVGKTTAEDAVP